MENPRAELHGLLVSKGQGWSSGGCSALVSCLPARISGSHFAIVNRALAPRTDESAPSPGSSSSTKRSDLAAGPTFSARTAPRYREAFVTMPSRRRICELLVAPQTEGPVAVRRPDLSDLSSGECVMFRAPTSESCLKSSRGSVRTVDPPSLSRRVRREFPDLNSPLTKRRSRHLLSEIRR